MTLHCRLMWFGKGGPIPTADSDTRMFLIPCESAADPVNLQWGRPHEESFEVSDYSHGYRLEKSQ